MNKILKLKDLKKYAGIKVQDSTSTRYYIYVFKESPMESMDYYVFNNDNELMPEDWPSRYRSAKWPRKSRSLNHLIELINREFRTYELMTLKEVKEIVFMTML